MDLELFRQRVRDSGVKHSDIARAGELPQSTISAIMHGFYPVGKITEAKLNKGLEKCGILPLSEKTPEPSLGGNDRMVSEDNISNLISVVDELSHLLTKYEVGVFLAERGIIPIEVKGLQTLLKQIYKVAKRPPPR